MHFRKGHHELSVMEAVDNLSHMAELDLTAPVEKVESKGLTEEQLKERLSALSWHDPEYYAYNKERIKETFEALLKYLKEIYEKDKGHMREEQMQRGIQAMMLLAGEAAQKVDHCTGIFKGEKVTELKAFKELQHFYLTKVVQRFHILPEVEEKWNEEWGAGQVSEMKEAPLRDLDAVRRDREYELFLVRQTDGTAFFNRPLLHHMQLVGQFDKLLADPTMEDPFLRIEMIADREAMSHAKEILNAAGPHIDEFYKQALKFKRVDFVASIQKALMALMMAADSRRLIQNVVGKHCLNYFQDFQIYLRKALNSAEYQKLASHPEEYSEGFLQSVYSLCHVLCALQFLKIGSRQEMVLFIHGLIGRGRKGSVTQGQTSSPLALWNNLRDKDDSLRFYLRQSPNGPLMKTIQLFKEAEQLSGFDPLSLQNQPMQLYKVSGEGLHLSCLRIPSPTVQEHIHKAEVAQEFYGFLRSLTAKKMDQRHLLINLQDRTSWQEHARCFVLEEIQNAPEFRHVLVEATLPKNTEFYFQSGMYIEWDDAPEFLKQLKDQVISKEECGFYFPKELHSKEFAAFVDTAIKTVHSVFFGSKERLLHKNRLDFIEIFYLLLALKLIDLCKPDTLSFTCKDGVDTSTAAAAGLYALLRMANGPAEWTKQEKDFLLWMLYAPSLSVRERPIDSMRFDRMASALAVIAAELEARHRKTVEGCAHLFKLPFFEGFKVQEASEQE